ncbi:MAG: hypothetical protein U0X89_05530 [Bacteroidia bacterium]
MHKMLRVIWGLLTKKEMYNAVTDKENQNKKVTAPKENKEKN